jgi:hypothetical protein
MLLAEGLRGQVGQGAVRPYCVVLPAPRVDQDSGLAAGEGQHPMHPLRQQAGIGGRKGLSARVNCFMCRLIATC